MTKEEIKNHIDYVQDKVTGGVVMSLTYDLDDDSWASFITYCLRNRTGGSREHAYILCNIETEYYLKKLMMPEYFDSIRGKISFKIEDNFQRELSVIPQRIAFCKVEALIFDSNNYDRPVGYIYSTK